MSLDEVLKKEKIKKSSLVEDYSSWRGSGFLYNVDTNEKIYGINGKVRRIYAFDNKEKYSGYGGLYFYFDDERKYLDGCRKIGKWIRDNFGNPYSVNYKGKYDKEQAWNNFVNPPKFTTWNEAKKYYGFDLVGEAVPFQWGKTTDNILLVNISPRINPEKYPSSYHLDWYNDENYNKPCKYYFIRLLCGNNNP